jgi:hypothetical protein
MSRFLHPTTIVQHCSTQNWLSDLLSLSGILEALQFACGGIFLEEDMISLPERCGDNAIGLGCRMRTTFNKRLMDEAGSQ